MPLIPKVPFVSGAVFTPEVATEMTGITFDNQPTYYGHFNKIADADLSDDPGALKNRVGALSANLKVTAGTGLNANYAAGKLLYGTTLYNIGASSIALAASTTNYIYGDLTGAILATSTQPPIVRALLATVLTNTSGVVSVTDYREGVSVEVVKPYNLSTRNFGGRGDQGNFLAVGGEILADGEYYYRNFTVPLGLSITISKLAYIYCTGTVNIAGTINVTPSTQGGGGTIASRTSLCIAGQGLGAGINQLLPLTYSFRASPIGSGGSSGFVYGNNTAIQQVLIDNLTGGGGSGGGGIIFEAAGAITVTGSILANGTAGAPGFLIDNGTIGYALGGGGGGSGGSITLKSLGSIVVSGTLSANGGAGGGGLPGNANVSAESGSGGGGGIITIQSPSINTTGSILSVNGGAAGAPSGVPITIFRGFGGIGGSYGGLSGQIIGDGGIGDAGIIRTQTFSPIG